MRGIINDSNTLVTNNHINSIYSGVKFSKR